MEKLAVTTAEKEKAEAEARRANQRLHAIRDAERREENKGLVGKTFRWRNCYSCPEKPSDYWWLYAKVQSMDGAGMLTAFTFQIDKYGQHEMKINRYSFNMGGGYRPIPAVQFNKAWRAFQKRIATAKP